MKNNFKLSAVVVAIAALGASACAQSPVGTWKGKLAGLPTTPPANIPEQYKAQYSAGVAKALKMVFVLTVKKDKTYSMNVPAGMGKGGTETGTWTLSGNTLSVKDPKGQVQKGTLSKNGKTLTFIMPGAPAGQKPSLVFTKS